MRILQLTTDLRFAGAERVVVNLARGLRDRGIECAVAGLFAGGEESGRTERILRDDGFEVFCAGMSRKWMLWRLAGLHRFARRWRPDLLHCHMFHGNAAGAMLRATGLGVPLIWTHHTAEDRDVSARGALYGLAYPLPDAHVFVSHAVRRALARRLGRTNRGRVIHNGIELDRFLSLRPAGGSTFAAVGRLIPEKGFDVLLRAFGSVREERPEARLRIAGRGPEREKLLELAEWQGAGRSVELAGFVDDVPGFLADASAFVMPSRTEGFGLTLLEAMAAGLPCIASRVGSLPEVGGDVVRWVPPDDVDALAGAMRELCGTEPEPGPVERRKRCARQFSRDAMVERYLSVYRQLLR